VIFSSYGNLAKLLNYRQLCIDFFFILISELSFPVKNENKDVCFFKSDDGFLLLGSLQNVSSKVDFKTANQINTDGKHIKVKNVNDILMTSLKRSASQPSFDSTKTGLFTLMCLPSVLI
jgi:hypothetical protein